jgi:hypothetical protein
MKNHACFQCFATLIASVLVLRSVSAEPTVEQREFFESRIRPVLIEHCYQCHSAQASEVEGGLRVDTPSGLRTGGESGPAIVPGVLADSLLLSALKYETYEMPPQGKLPEHVIADFTRWIEQGAPDPRPDEPSASPRTAGIDLEEGRQFWAFRPPQRSAAPGVQRAEWPRDDVDRYLLAKMEAAGIEPAADADRLVLLRRLFLDLIGLLPDLDEIAAFEADRSPDAVERLVDRLLASPQFGERWGRHWLDVARYADSTGGGRSMLYGESWYYRNYIIRAFQEDKPLSRLILEQVAGDLLPAASLREQRDNLIATAFLTLGPTNYEMQDKGQLRMEVVDEQIEIIGKSLLGMTIGCARCHDHKFDPIPQQDYYALAGIFRNTQTLIDDNVSTWVKRPYPLEPEAAAAVAAHQQQIAATKGELARLKQELEQLQGPLTREPQGLVLDEADAELIGEWTASTFTKPFVGAGYHHSSTTSDKAVFRAKVTAGEYEVYLAHTPGQNRCPNTLVQIEHAEGVTEERIDQRAAPTLGRYNLLGKFHANESGLVITISGEGKQPGVMIADAVLLVSTTTADAGGTPAALAEADAIETRRATLQAEVTATETRLKELEKTTPPVPQLLSVKDFDKIEDCPLYLRGNLKTPGPRVPRGFLTVATTEPLPEFPADQSGRLQLAEWLSSPTNPLTARVYVNRVWSKLFGQGIVRTVDNFGIPGDRPSHPELLDQLALDFMADGWSTKKLIRRLVLTRAYQLAVVPENPTNDVDNRLLSRQNPRRLDAECLHDALLQVSGELQLEPVHDAVRPGTKTEYGYQFSTGPRAVYLPIFRNQLHDLHAVFDFPNPNLPQGQRNVSTLSTQALFLLNSQFVIDRSLAAGKRLLGAEANLEDLTAQLYLQALTRRPTPSETELIRAYIAEQLAEGVAEPVAWGRAVQAVFASIDFRYR